MCGDLFAEMSLPKAGTLKKPVTDVALLPAVGITIGSVVRIWIFRFLPLDDYPIWLYALHLRKGV